MKNFAAIIFDMDGLLLDTERPAFEAFCSTCSLFKTGDLSRVYMKCIGANQELGDAILKNGLKGIADYEEFNLAWEDEYKKLTKDTPPALKEGVVELLNHILVLGTPMAVATSSTHKRAEKKLFQAGISHFFSHITGGDQVEKSKPDPEVYLKTALALSSDPSTCLAFEDSKNGVKSAMAAGMTVVQIPDLVLPDQELLETGHIILQNLTDVLAYDFKNGVGGKLN